MKSLSLVYVAIAFLCSVGIAANDTHRTAPTSDSQALQRESFMRDAQTRMASADAKIERLRQRMNVLPEVSPERETIKLTIDEYRTARAETDKSVKDIQMSSAKNWVSYKDTLKTNLDKLDEIASSNALAE